MIPIHHRVIPLLRQTTTFEATTVVTSSCGEEQRAVRFAASAQGREAVLVFTERGDIIHTVNGKTLTGFEPSFLAARRLDEILAALLPGVRAFLAMEEEGAEEYARLAVWHELQRRFSELTGQPVFTAQQAPQQAIPL